MLQLPWLVFLGLFSKIFMCISYSDSRPTYTLAWTLRIERPVKTVSGIVKMKGHIMEILR